MHMAQELPVSCSLAGPAAGTGTGGATTHPRGQASRQARRPGSQGRACLLPREQWENQTARALIGFSLEMRFSWQRRCTMPDQMMVCVCVCVRACAWRWPLDDLLLPLHGSFRQCPLISMGGNSLGVFFPSGSCPALAGCLGVVGGQGLGSCSLQPVLAGMEDLGDEWPRCGRQVGRTGVCSPDSPSTLQGQSHCWMPACQQGPSQHLHISWVPASL